MKSSLIIIFLLLPFITLAGGGGDNIVDGGLADFTPLIGIPGIQETGDINSYVNALYGLAISIAALIAVVKIVLAGAKYMMDDIVTHKSEAKEDIKNSLIGLLIIIGAWIILATVNSDLTNLSLNTERAFTDQSVPALTNVDEFINFCADINRTGGCSKYSCQVLFDELVSYAAVGCAAGGTAGLWVGGSAGSSFPLVGNIVGGLGGLGIGCAGGAIVGGFGALELDEGTCRIGCNLAGGYIGNDLQCWVPNSSEVFSRAQLQELFVKNDQEREEQKVDIATNQNVQLSTTLDYFGIDETALTPTQFGQSITSINDINPDDRLSICRVHDVCDEADISKVKGKFTMFKQVCTLAECTSQLDEYNVMQANLEVKAREICKGGKVMKVQAVDTTNVQGIGSEIRTTTLYCIS